MDVLLDSNIYLQDLHMTGNRFQELFTYLRRTDSPLLLPHLVREEVVGKYATLLKESSQKAKQAFEQVSRLSTEAKPQIQLPNIDSEVEGGWRRLWIGTREIEAGHKDIAQHISYDARTDRVGAARFEV